MTAQQEIDAATTLIGNLNKEVGDLNAQIQVWTDQYHAYVDRNDWGNAIPARQHLPALVARLGVIGTPTTGLLGTGYIDLQKGKDDLKIEQAAKQQIIDAEKARIAALPTNQQNAATAASTILASESVSKTKYWIIGGIAAFLIVAILIYAKMKGKKANG